LELRARAIPLLGFSDQVPDGGGLGELRIVQPLLAADLSLWRGRMMLIGNFNLEGATIPGGELALGDWGEGFVDRRHPHTYLHELMAVVTSSPDRGWQVGGALGKGFVSFGTDDPMSRPPIRYPVNHHWAQVLERAVLLGQLRHRWVTVEGSLFNGDEPESPDQWPKLDRLGDSWALRVSLTPLAGVEGQVSRARVESPEHRPGAGLEHRQWSASARLERRVAGRAVYGLVEWARTTVGPDIFRFSSVLGEGAIRLGRIRPYYRFERTERPEEERTSAFRSRRPLLENSILGTSRWTTHTAGLGLERPGSGRWSLEPTLEATVGHIAKAGPGLFQVADWYDSPRFWSLTVGVRLELGRDPHRMGRYGVLATARGVHPH